MNTKRKNQKLIVGKVVKGNQVGRTIGFPTANLQFNYKLIKKGVYGVKVFIDKNIFYGLMNIGTRPTLVNDDDAICCEVHILDFNQNIYNHLISVEVLYFLRNERKFETIEGLVDQIEKDVTEARRIFQDWEYEKSGGLYEG